jgi:hypothetical protein
MPVITQSQRDQMKLLEGTMSYRRIASVVGCCHATVSRVLGERVGSRSEHCRVHSVDHSYFSKLTDESAYWLGFISADGCVHKAHLRIDLGVKDMPHLLKLRDALSSTHPVSQIPSRPSIARFVVSSPDIVKDLGTYGVVPNKTFKLEFPSNIPDDLLRHYIRGFFDGDGCASRGCFSVVGSYLFIKGLQDYLVNVVGIRRNKLTQLPNKNPNTASLANAAKHDIALIYDYMYSGATVYLDRKRILLEPAIGQDPNL